MKTAIYIENGVVQLVLTPEDDFEKSVIGSYDGKHLQTSVKMGSFYECAGNYHRQSSDRSLIIRVDRNPTVGEVE